MVSLTPTDPTEYLAATHCDDQLYLQGLRPSAKLAQILSHIQNLADSPRVDTAVTSPTSGRNVPLYFVIQ